MMLRKRPRTRAFGDEVRTAIPATERKRPLMRWVLGALFLLLLAALLVGTLGPLLFLAKSAVSPTQDTLRDPLAWFPSGQFLWENIPYVWGKLRIGHYLGNTAIMSFGAAIFSVLVAGSGAYVLSVIRPRWGRFVEGLLLITLFVPGIVSLVPLYLTIIKMPVVGLSLFNTFWAVWLPAGANAFNVLLVKRMMDGLPGELFEAAEIDGASHLRVMWSIAFPLTRPILGVVALLSLVAAWKDYLWPMLVLQSPDVQPLNVALPLMSENIELNFFMAALFIAVIIPVALFLVFQRQFLNGVASSSGISAS